MEDNHFSEEGLRWEARLVNRQAYGELATISMEQEFNIPLAKAGILLTDLEALAARTKSKVVCDQMRVVEVSQNRLEMRRTGADPVTFAVEGGFWFVNFPVSAGTATAKLSISTLQAVARQLREDYESAQP